MPPRGNERLGAAYLSGRQPAGLAVIVDQAEERMQIDLDAEHDYADEEDQPVLAQAARRPTATRVVSDVRHYSTRLARDHRRLRHAIEEAGSAASSAKPPIHVPPVFPLSGDLDARLHSCAHPCRTTPFLLARTHARTGTRPDATECELRDHCDATASARQHLLND